MTDMTPRRIALVSLTLAFSIGFANCSAADGRTNVTDVIEFGSPRSTLIISGEFLCTFSGGGGATSAVKVDKVFKAPKGFQTPTEVEVYWTTRKKYEHIMVQKNTNQFLFFLQEDTECPRGYRDVTRETYPFVRATEANVRLLNSKLTEKK